MQTVVCSCSGDYGILVFGFLEIEFHQFQILYIFRPHQIVLWTLYDLKLLHFPLAFYSHNLEKRKLS